MFIKRIIFILAALITAAPMFAVTIINANARDRILGEYIVVFKSEKDIATIEGGIKSRNGEILFRYRHALLADAARLPQAALSFVMESNVASIEANVPATPAATSQRQQSSLRTSVPTGLDRIDQRLLALNGQFQSTETGQGVHAYVIDTGIRFTHNEFTTGRVSNGYSAFVDNHGTNDCNGHGTHVAGTIGGNTYGVAKKVTLHPVRVLDCSGYGSEATILAGIDWVTKNKISPAVANMSLRLTYASPALEQAVQNSINQKVTYVVAAGNLLGGDACNYSPAHLADAITVGSVDPANDKRSVLSATGVCIDLFAPGVRILSATVSGNDNGATEEMSGTSTAAPHVSGVAALYLQNHTTATPSQVRNAIRHNDNVSTTPGWPGIVNAGPCSPNELLHWGPADDGFSDGDPPPKGPKDAARP